MVSYLYFLNLCFSISEDGRYLSYSNIKQYESGHPWRTSHVRLKGSNRRPFFLSFRLDLGVRDFNLVNEFASITKLEKGPINLRITNLWQNKTYEGHKFPTYSVKDSPKLKDVQGRLRFKLCKTSITSRMVENVCNIDPLLIAADWF